MIVVDPAHGSGCRNLDTVAVKGLELGVSSHTELLVHAPNATPGWFTIVIIALANVSVIP
jgi:hypothetical protein